MKLRVVVGLVFWFALGAGVCAQPTVFFQPEHAIVTGSGCSSPELCVDVRVDSIPAMAGYDIEITFEPQHLNFLEAREGDMFTLAGHSSVFFWTLVGGSLVDTVVVNTADLGGWVSGAGHIFSLCFVPPWSDEVVNSPLAFVRCLVRDSANADVPVVTRDGTISVYCPTSADNVGWSAIKSLYR